MQNKNTEFSYSPIKWGIAMGVVWGISPEPNLEGFFLGILFAGVIIPGLISFYEWLRKQDWDKSNASGLCLGFGYFAWLNLSCLKSHPKDLLNDLPFFVIWSGLIGLAAIITLRVNWGNKRKWIGGILLASMLMSSWAVLYGGTSLPVILPSAANPSLTVLVIALNSLLILVPLYVMVGLCFMLVERCAKPSSE